ncbi:excinuclease ABC subunit UvrA [Paenibacillus sacheonensis]|uniref:UvrABC system protein A n=1 Tax=Paenibacillus sacheonensis TaxID=742054 RepID=A0A7X4YQJ4_9BACL|nr:excinuclease ABC subunit UvrA [Paenibacillus sacheonensis]MBM7566714.1 excinuclease ABC subunit A [Paenibacillus sacheonensis]NBC70693.1 excinuclease ABC subunit UvrA [Paenibacillus sacheonensis]
MKDTIQIVGAFENNLKNVSLHIPKYKLVVLTGPSGSGKSTLAMDTLQRECQRQYMESMGMVSDSINKPKVGAIVGLSPSISVGQHVTNRNPRSTVGTVTDIYTYMRTIYARAGERPCPHCGGLVPPPPAEAAGMNIANEEERQEWIHCPHCDAKLEKLTMTHFSFNTLQGACETCSGLGSVATLRMDAIFHTDKGLRGGGVPHLYDMMVEYYANILTASAKHYGFAFDPELPLKDYPEAQLDLLYYGTESEQFTRHYPDVKPPRTVALGKFEGIVTGIWRRYKEKGVEAEGGMNAADFFHQQECPACRGAKLNAVSRSVQVGGSAIHEVTELPLEEVLAWTERVTAELPSAILEMLATFISDEIPSRLKRILHVGLGYLSLNRQTVTLSGGEAQRLRLASLLGSGLTGVLYILDEPTAGLHPRDTAGLILVMKQLRDLGNTVLVIEHDVDMMRAADHVIDMGPGAGSMGGRVVGEGTLADLMASPESVTGAYLREESAYRARPSRRPGNGSALTVRGATARNLKNVTVSFPLGRLVAVTGVSGSGKSTLLFDLLAEGANDNLRPEGCAGIEGTDNVGNWITVDQSPIGRMQRSNVATYTDLFTAMRNLFAGLPAAKKLKLTSKHFSFNTAGGRCENCQGLGVLTVDMHFLPDIEVRCPACKGRRFQDEVLQVTYEGYSISDLLDMTVQESLAVFENNDKMAETIRLLCEVGLGYLHWGQSVRTLSGGEGQRLRLAKELAKRTKKHTLYLLDEPTTGLHPADVRQLTLLLDKLVDAGNTVIVVEHNLELIRECDWIIDIGPEGGEGGGSVVAEGTPEQVAQVRQSHTGRYLREALGS